MPVDDPQPGELWRFGYAAICDEVCCADRVVLRRRDHHLEVQQVGHISGRNIGGPLEITLNALLDGYGFQRTVVTPKKEKTGFSKFVTRIECTEVKDE